MNQIELAPIKESTDDYEKIEEAILDLLKKEIYYPLLRSIGESKSIVNSRDDDLVAAIRSSRIVYHHGGFTGRINSKVSKRLKSLGATWKLSSWKISASKLPKEVTDAIHYSQRKIFKSFEAVQTKLTQIVPEEIADKLKVSKLFDSTLYKVNAKMEDQLKNITVTPTLTKEQSTFISDEYEKNMKLYIKDWSEKEIVRLRKKMQSLVFEGVRHEDLADMIQESFGTSQSKAKFLARQETALLMTKFKESRYTELGVKKYRWQCVAGSKNHPVRPMHKALDGKVFSWDNPPVTDNKGNRNNAGADYNCRCLARPILEFNKV